MSDITSAKRAPEWLYKYQPFTTRSLEILIRRELFFPQPHHLNDPFDTALTFATDEERSADNHLVAGAPRVPRLEPPRSRSRPLVR